MTEPGTLPEGFTVDAVDWLPSGARSGLVRVRGHRPPAVAGPLPELILETGGETRRYVSLPDPRADRDPTAWRGAYVLEAQPAAEADQLWLEWPGARRIALPPLSVPEHQVARSAEAEEHPAPSQGEVVVDRAVLAERRARRAEASEQAQARISREALRAVEVLELRIAELEQRAMLAEDERDALRDRTEPGVQVDGQAEELLALRAALAAREAELARQPVAEAPAAPVRIPAADAERRAERLRAALTATVATVAELRMRVHELQVARRTRDVAAAADGVRLSVLEREQAAAQVELETARTELQGALHARDEAAAALEGVRAEHEELRAQFAEASAELGDARERITELEGEVAAAAAVAEQVEDTEALRARLEAAEAAIAEAETARELAEASALAAASRHHAAEVARAARAPRPGPELRAAPAPRVPDSLLAAAAEAERAAAQRQPTEESERVVADLEAAAAALREAEPEPIGEPELRPHVSFDPVIVSASTEPPGAVARGRGSREYPPLRGALVKLAHDDPAAAGRILAGLLRAQHAVLDGSQDYDLTIAEVGTFAVSTIGGATNVRPIDAPRGRAHAAFHLQTDALTLAESIAGVEARPRRRRGPLRATGKVRTARRFTESLRTDASLTELVHAGAEIDPELALRALGYAVRPAWIQGQQWLVEITVAERPLTVAARHSGGLSVSPGPAEGEPDARLRLSSDAFRGLVAGDAAEPVGEGDERVLRRLLSLAERARTGAA